MVWESGLQYWNGAFSNQQVIKSARVMKKAVGHLIPFMEKEREEQFAEMGGCSVEESLAVSKWHLKVESFNSSF